MRQPNSEMDTNVDTFVTDENGNKSPNRANEPSESALSQVSKLLRGEEDEPNTESVEGEADEGLERSQKGKTRKGPPKSLHDAAELLGIKVEDIYKLQVGLANDETPYTLGELKDSFSERENFAVEQLAWGEEKANQEAELLRSRNELTELLTLLPPSAIKPEVLNKIREKHAAAIQRERNLTMTVISEWKNEEVRNTDLQGMTEHLVKAGFPKDYLKNVSDHKTMRYIRENYLREKRINDALARVKKIGKPSQQKPSSNQTSRGGKVSDAKRTGRIDPAVQQISQLLRGD